MKALLLLFLRYIVFTENNWVFWISSVFMERGSHNRETGGYWWNLVFEKDPFWPHESTVEIFIQVKV